MIKQEEKAKNLQEKYMEFQTMQYQLQELQQANEKVDEELINLNALKQALDDFSKLKEGDEILVTVANGIFAKAKLMDSKKLKMSVGADITTTKTVGGVKNFVEKQEDSLKTLKEKLNEDMQNIFSKLKNSEKELKKLIKEDKEK